MKSQRKPTLLIVEDVEEMRVLLVDLFKDSGKFSRVVSAQDGVDARGELLRQRPDLVLLDEVLPGESATDLLGDLIREEIPVILMTSLASGHPYVKSSKLPKGVLGRLIKPSWESLSEDQPKILNFVLKAFI